MAGWGVVFRQIQIVWRCATRRAVGPSSVGFSDERFIAEIGQHRMVAVVKPTAEDIAACSQSTKGCLGVATIAERFSIPMPRGFQAACRSCRWGKPPTCGRATIAPWLLVPREFGESFANASAPPYRDERSPELASSPPKLERARSRTSGRGQPTPDGCSRVCRSPAVGVRRDFQKLPLDGRRKQPECTETAKDRWEHSTPIVP